MRIEIPLVGPTAADEPTDINPQRTINWYARPGGDGGAAPFVLRSRPGLTLAGTLGNGPIRGAREIQSGTSPGNRSYVVSGNRLYQLDGSLTGVQKATLLTSTGPVQITDNGTEILIVESSYQSALAKAYYYNMATTGFADLTDLHSKAYTSGGGGGKTIAVGDTLTGATSTKTGIVVKYTTTSGTWAAGDAAGTLWITSKSGTFVAENLDKGATADVMTIAAGDFTDISLDFIPGTCDFLDQLFLATANQSGKLYWNALLDGLDWPALQFVTAEGLPDNLVAVKVVGRNAWLFGEESSEVYAPTGDIDEAVARVPGAVIDWGCAAPNAVVRIGNDVFWLGKGRMADRVILRGSGYSAAPISDSALERALAGYSTVTDALAFGYHRDGQDFVTFHFPTEGKSWTYAGGAWFESGYWNSTTAAMERDLGETYFHFLGQHLVGSRSDGKVYELDPAVFTDNGATIRRVRVTPPVGSQGKRIRWNGIFLEVAAGVGNLAAPGVDPVLQMRYSDDGGHTWSPSRELKVGKRGAFNEVVQANRLGQSRRRTFEFVATDSVDWTLLRAWGDVDVLDG